MIATDTAFNKAQQSELPTSTYLSPAEVAEIFPDITVDQLCQQLSDITLVHNEVPVIVPSFAVDQMSRFLQLIEVSSLAPVALPAKKPLQSEPTGVQVLLTTRSMWEYHHWGLTSSTSTLYPQRCEECCTAVTCTR